MTPNIKQAPLRHALGLLTLLIVALMSGTATARLNAQQITADNVVELQRQGPDAIGGIGDWHISNGTLCAVISDVEHEGQFSTKGGNLIDLGFCDRADDFFPLSSDLVDGTQLKRFDAQSVNINADNEINVVSRYNNVEMTVRYYFNENNATELRIEKLLTLLQDDDSFNFVTPLQFNYRSLEPFVFSSEYLERSNGFKQEDFVSRGVSAMTVAARSADTVITIAPPSAKEVISYGWQMRSAQRIKQDGQAYDVPHFVLADNESTAMLVLADSFYIGDGSRVGWIQLAQVPLLSLDFEDSLRIQESVFVSKQGDVAGITDQLFAANNASVFKVSANLLETRSSVHFDLLDGTPVTHAVPDTEGRIQVDLPPGEYQARIYGLGDRSNTESFSVRNSPLDLGRLNLDPIAQVQLPQGEAMRLIFVGENETLSPSFNDHLTGASVMESYGLTEAHRNNHVFLAGIDSDPNSVQLPKGRYEVLATKGPEYSLTRTHLDITNSETRVLEIETPVRQVNSEGFISSDLHVHSGASFDNAFSDEERVRSFAAEHAEIMVSSEHDIPTDFNPIIERMGLSDVMISIPAAEMTSLLSTKRLPFTSGHANFFPYPPKPDEFARGMINHEDKRLREIIAHVKAEHPEILVQLNHPRKDGALSGEIPDNYEDLISNGDFLEHMGVAGHPYQPDLPIDTVPNNTLIETDPETGVRDIDFDLLEVINPGHDRYQERLETVRKDWLSFIKQGFKIVGVANSDSHGYSEQVGVPRTMVAMPDDSIAGFDQSQFIRSLKNGNAYGSNGPIMTVSLNEQSMGATVIGASAELSVTVLASDWMPVSELRIQINGETIKTVPLTNGLRDQTVTQMLNFEKDSFVTVEVSGPVSDDYRKVYAHIAPYAFSNPIYVDANADGEWQAPGL